jgi:hypothetical protein
MPITPDNTARADDFIFESEKDGTPANDEGRVPKLESDGKLDSFFTKVKFGGDGSDGALTISSGTTTIDLAGAKVLIKNYSSISITGTGKLAFSNPHANGSVIVIKSKGNVTLTSSQAPMIDCSGLGGTGGVAVNRSSAGVTNGNAGTDGQGLLELKTGAGGGGAGVGSGGAGGSILTPITPYYATAFSYPAYQAKYPLLFVGGGGGSGMVATSGAGNGTSGVGGRGGGCLVIECGGAINFTTSDGISVAGANGGDGVINSSLVSVTGGGGGGGGCAFIFYNILTAVSGTIKVSGGTGGLYHESYNDSNRGGGGGGGYAGGSTGIDTGVDGATSGGAGGVGFSLITQNTF